MVNIHVICATDWRRPTVFDMYWPRLQATRQKRHMLKVLTEEFDVPVARQGENSTVISGQSTEERWLIFFEWWQRVSLWNGKVTKKPRNLQREDLMPLKILTAWKSKRQDRRKESALGWELRRRRNRLNMTGAAAESNVSKPSAL